MSRRAYEHVIARVLLAPDPVTELERAIVATRDLRLRAWLRAIDRDGLRMSALLVARLRCERVLRGSRWASTLFEADPAAFTAVFARYHTSVPPRAFNPAEEGEAFRRFVESRTGP